MSNGQRRAAVDFSLGLVSGQSWTDGKMSTLVHSQCAGKYACRNTINKLSVPLKVIGENVYMTTQSTR
eukprot:2661024-Pleurochrysis_carterae.AAC.2